MKWYYVVLFVIGVVVALIIIGLAISSLTYQESPGDIDANELEEDFVKKYATNYLAYDDTAQSMYDKLFQGTPRSKLTNYCEDLKVQTAAMVKLQEEYDEYVEQGMKPSVLFICTSNAAKAMNYTYLSCVEENNYLAKEYASKANDWLDLTSDCTDIYFN